MKRSAIGRVVMVFGLPVVIGLAGTSCMVAESGSGDVAQMVAGADRFLTSLSDAERARDIRLRIGREREVPLRSARDVRA